MTGLYTRHGTNPNLFGGTPLSFDDCGFDDESPVTTDFVWINKQDIPAEATLWGESEEDRLERIHGSDESDPTFNEDYYFEEAYLCRDKALEGVSLNDEVIRHSDKRFSHVAIDFERAGRKHSDADDIEELIAEDSPIDIYTPSFSSNHEGPLKLSWDEGDAKLARRWYKGERRGSGKQRAPKWQQFAGSKRRAKRDSFRRDQVEAFDAYYLEYQGYTAEDYLDDHVALLSEEDQAFYEADYVRFEESYAREINSSFDPISHGDVINEAWDRVWHPERYETHVPYRSSFWDYDDYDYYDYSFEDSPEDEFEYYAQFDDSDSFEDGYHYDDFDDEWVEIDRIAIERMEEEDAENFCPRYGSTIIRCKIRRSPGHDAKHGFQRSKSHTLPRGWKRFSPPRRHGRETIRLNPSLLYRGMRSVESSNPN